MVVGLLYLRRIQARLHCMVLTSRTLQRLFLVAVMAASKFIEDIPLSNEGWAEMGGITLAEVNALEIDFLFGIEFDLSVSQEEYARLADELRHPTCRDFGIGCARRTSHCVQSGSNTARAASADAAHGDRDSIHMRGSLERRGSCNAEAVAAEREAGRAASEDHEVTRGSAPLCSQAARAGIVKDRINLLGLLSLGSRSVPFIKI